MLYIHVTVYLDCSEFIVIASEGTFAIGCSRGSLRSGCMFMTDGYFQGRQSDLKFVAALRVLFPCLLDPLRGFVRVRYCKL